MRNYLVTLNNFVLLPNATIYRGSGKYDFYADETALPQIIKEKLIELKEDTTVVYRKIGENKKISAELKKEGKDTHKNKDKIDGAKK